MSLAELKKKMKRWAFYTRLWFWAAVHSPGFKKCQFGICKLPVKLVIERFKYSSVYLSVRLEFNRLDWFLYIPSDVYGAFTRLHKEELAPPICDEDEFDDIPF